MVAVDEGRVHADVDLPVDQVRAADEAHDHLELARRLDVELGDRLDPGVGDVGELDARVKGDGRENRHLGRGVGAVHVVGRVGLGEPAALRLGERLAVRGAALHLGEDEVGRAVDDAEDRGARSSRSATRAAP